VSKKDSKPARSEGDNKEDNARKFITNNFDTDFLQQHNAILSSLEIDWIAADEYRESKVVYRKYSDGKRRYLLITKLTAGKNRTASKTEIDENRYHELVASSCLRLLKDRYEFHFVQDNIFFVSTFDVFDTGKLFILEVDGVNGNEEERLAFDPRRFPYDLLEVTGNIEYYGFRLVHTLDRLVS